MFEPLLTAWQQLHFLRPHFLWLLLLPIAIYSGLWFFNSSRIKGWSIKPHLLNVLLVNQKKLQRINPITVSLLLSLLIILVLAGPSWQKQTTPFMQDSSDLVLVLAITPSMAQTDIQPSRLARAKQKIYDLLQQRQGGRVSLIVYAGTAHRVVPLTADKDIIWNFLLAIDNDVMPVAGDKLTAVLPLLNNLQTPSTANNKTQAQQNNSLSLLLLTDNSGADEAANFAAAIKAMNNIDFQLLGIGKLNVADNQQPLNEALLKSLARQSGGNYQRITNNNDDVTAIQHRIKKQTAKAKNNDQRPWQDNGYFLLFPIALMFLLWFRKGWTLQWCISIVFIANLMLPNSAQANEPTASQNTKTANNTPWLDAWLTPDQKGQYYFKKQQYINAANAYQNNFKKGVAFYYAGKFARAAEVFAKIDNEQAKFYQANSLAQQRNYVPAQALYRDILKANPTHKKAKINLAIVNKIIKETDDFTDKQQEEQSDGGQDLGQKPQSSQGSESKMGNAKSKLGEKPKQKGDDAPTMPGTAKTNQLTAEQLLQDQSLQESWMKEVTQNPSAFLGAKFQIQAGEKNTDNNKKESEAEL